MLLATDHGIEAITDESGGARYLRWMRRLRAKILAKITHGTRSGDILKRVRGCGFALGATVEIRTVNGKAFYHGLKSCGNIWTCATCAQRIRVRRQQELERALQHHTATGGGLMMITLTMRHHDRQDLQQLLDDLQASWTNLQAKSSFRSLMTFTPGFVRALEVTYGNNGWHPHFHVIIPVPPTMSEDVARARWEALRLPWSASLATINGQRTDHHSIEHGFDLLWFGADAPNAAQYVTKLAKEATLSQSKTSGATRDPFTLLDDSSPQSTAMFLEYVEATADRRALTYSDGLKHLLGLQGPKDDKELADDNEVVGVHALEMTANYYNGLTTHEQIALLEWSEFQHRYDTPPEVFVSSRGPAANSPP